MRPITLTAIFSALTALVFAIDVRTRLGANIPLLYIVPVLITLWYARSRGLVAPAICTALTILRVLWFPSGDWLLGVVNRALTIFALWSTAILLLQFKRAEARLKQREELARFGEMAIVIAHELRNAICGIRTAVEVFGARLTTSERDQAVRQAMVERVDSLERFITDLLAFSRPITLALLPIHLIPVIERAAEALKRDAALSDVRVETGGDDIVLPLDEVLMGSALSNLILNAAQAMNGTGTISIRVERQRDTCRVSIRDTGPGMAADVLQRILTPFFTTRSHGTGLGLPIAKRAIERHGGTLTIESRPGSGTTAIVTLPVAIMPLGKSAH